MPPKGATARSRELRNDSFKKWNLPGFDEPFLQDPLTFFEKNEFLGIMGSAIEAAMENGADIYGVASLLGMSDEDMAKIQKGEIDFAMLPAAQGMLSILTRVMRVAPRIVQDIYLLALSVAHERWEEVRPALLQIDDDTGFGILETFIEQNAETIKDFLPRWVELGKTTLNQIKKPAESTASTD